MQQILWNPPPASSPAELMDILMHAAAGIKTQVLASPILGDPSAEVLKASLSQLADTLNALQHDVAALSTNHSPRVS